MTREELVRFLRKKPSYIKKGAKYISDTFETSLHDAIEALKQCREEQKNWRYKPQKRLFFDIETSPNVVYTWRTGYNIQVTHESIIQERKIISIHWKWQGRDKVRNLHWDKDQDDKAMLEKFIPILHKADEVIAHHGDRFDVPWLRTRCLFHRIPMHVNIKTLDTRKKAKAHFNFNSNKLDYIAQFLKVGKKREHEGYSLWLKTMNGDKEALRTMLEYGDHDVVLLEEIYFLLAPYMKHNTHHGVIEGNGKASCPNCGSVLINHVKPIVTGMGTVQRLMKCLNCETDFKLANTVYLNSL